MIKKKEKKKRMRGWEEQEHKEKCDSNYRSFVVNVFHMSQSQKNSD